MTVTETRTPGPQQGATGVRRIPTAVLVALTLVVVAAGLGAVHLTQGTAGLSLSDIVDWILGRDLGTTGAVMIDSRLPRLAAGALVGVALGVAGGLLQSVARNPLASPDTLAVNAGGYLAVTAFAAFGISLPLVTSGMVAFLGGLLAAGLVLLLAQGGSSGPTRLILAGSAIALALNAITTVLLVLFSQETSGLYAWGAGSITQSGTTVVSTMWPVVIVGVAAALLLARRLDLLGLGDDTAAVLGVPVVSTRVFSVTIAVVLSAAAITLAGPIGFVGLCAPALVRIMATRIPAYSPHLVRLPMSALCGVIVVIGADVLLRWIAGDQAGIWLPTGIVTSLFGALLLVVLARRIVDSEPGTADSAAGRPRSGRFVVTLSVVLAGVTLIAVLVAVLLGDRIVLTGDVLNWLTGESGRVVTASLNERVPRVLCAVLAGAGLAIAGTVIQGVSRNSLAEPGILGITGGAGVGAVSMLALNPGAGVWTVGAAGAVGAVIAFAVVYGLSYRQGLNSDRLVLIGIGMGAATASATTGIVLMSNPHDVTYALTWLSGTTYGRTFDSLLPIVIGLVVCTPVVYAARNRIDLIAVDDDVPRVLGIRLERTRLGLLIGAVALTVAAVCAVGVLGFVGLVAPHAARLLVGSRTAHVLPVAALLGATLVTIADTIGRTVIAPAQFPAGLVTALLGTPYFIYLLARSRSRG